jgi:single-stranded-DNA-specific exonuclease
MNQFDHKGVLFEWRCVAACKDSLASTLQQYYCSRVSVKDYWPECLYQKLLPGIRLLLQHIKQKNKIIVFGDYDVDGICASVLISKFLNTYTCNVVTVIPNRITNGYGLSQQFIEQLHDTKLLITLDNGTTAIHEVQLARDKNIDVIILDHHLPTDQLPNANFIFNPKCYELYTSCAHIEHLCATGVTFVFILEVQKYLQSKGITIKKMHCMLDLVALATVCDVMPAIGLNRSLLYHGIKLLQSRSSNWSKLLVNTANVNTETLGFSIGPYINAAGRFADANTAYQFLYTDDHNEQVKLLGKLVHYNERRKQLEQEILDNITVHDNDAVYVHLAEDWPEGIVGVIAARLKDKLNKPVIVLTRVGNNYKGSARSTTNLHIGNCVQAAKHLIVSGGGHAMAAGLTVHESNVHALKLFVNEYYARNCHAIKETKTFYTYLSVYALTRGNAFEQISVFEPFGVQHEKPLFCFCNVTMQFQHTINGKHALFKISDSYNGCSVSCMLFNYSRSAFVEILSACPVHCHIIGSISQYNNRLSISVVDIVMQ